MQHQAQPADDLLAHRSERGRAVPELAGGWPLLGHLREFQRDPVAMLARAAQEQGELFRFRLGPRDFALFAGPEAHDAYFKAPEDQLDAKSVYQFTVPIFGRGVVYDVA
ncbi:MAG: cytochrome P450, partial [Gammaproteobacteria bacterium]|nr:cytochrome P450 [Gammaproteobacteria bacterium]